MVVSASEKLKALEARAADAPWVRATSRNSVGDGPIIKNEDDFDWVASVQVSNVSNWRENAELIVALRNALPQIVAVVDAAETLTTDFQISAAAWNDAQRRCSAALAALEEALQ